MYRLDTRPLPPPGLRAARALLVLAAALPASPAAAAGELPVGWIKGGNAPRQYRAGTDSEVTRGGRSSAYLLSRVASPPVYGALIQTIAADDFRGRRLEIRGWLKTEGVDEEGWAGLVMRIDGPGSESLAYDNMQDRPVEGTADWSRHSVVLDVPETAVTITFGFTLVGSGQAWADDLTLEAVGREVEVTGVRRKPLPRQPVNLGFEQTEEATP